MGDHEPKLKAQAVLLFVQCLRHGTIRGSRQHPQLNLQSGSGPSKYPSLHLLLAWSQVSTMRRLASIFISRGGQAQRGHEYLCLFMG